MKEVRWSKGMFLVASMSVFILGCDNNSGATAQGGGGGGPGECNEELATAKKDLSKVESELSGSKDGLEKCAAGLTAKTTELEEAQAKLKRFTESPAGVYQDIISQADAASTVAAVDDVLAEIEKFASRFPTAAERKALKKRASKLKKSRRTFEKAEVAEKALAAIKEVKTMLSSIEDGTDLAVRQALAVGEYLKQKDLTFEGISKLPKGSYSEAMKDPDSERGKAIIASGKVIQISKDGGYFKGLICADSWCNKIVYFLTPGTTRGINQGKRGKFAGVMTQKYSYDNVRGGQTHSILLVGYFRGQG